MQTCRWVQTVLKPGSTARTVPYGYAGSKPRRLQAAFKRRTWVLAIRVAEALKRTMDIVTPLLAFAVLSPLFLLIALVIHLQDGGPVLFWQTRVGLRGREFRFPKFRSMVVNAETRKAELLASNHYGDDIKFKMKRDPRITRVGAVLRKLSLDEAPQLWCVLRGDMSLVGPRPSLPSEVARYGVEDRRRLDVKPGLTCFWQVSGRSDLPFEQQVRLDAQYIDSQSVWLDIALLFRTIPAILTGRGAY